MPGIFDLNFIFEAELARQLSRCRATLERWRMRGIGPSADDDVQRWISAQEGQPPPPRKDGRVTGRRQAVR